MRTGRSILSGVLALAAVLTLVTSGTALALAAAQVPWKGSAAGAVVGVEPTSEGVRLTIHASGTATQLGHFQRVEELLLNPDTGAVTGTIVFVAANSDELHANVVGGFVSPTTALGDYEFVGGTGRFANASGSASFEAVSPDGIQVAVQFSGTISSVGN
jgi:hypothetical protein